MSENLYDCNCDLVIEMQEMGIGVEEILQYARGILDQVEIRAMISGLERMIPSRDAVEQFYG